MYCGYDCFYTNNALIELEKTHRKANQILCICSQLKCFINYICIYQNFRDFIMKEKIKHEPMHEKESVKKLHSMANKSNSIF